MKFIVLSSSRGTTFQSVIDRLNDGTLKMQCLGLISDSADHQCVEKAKHAGLPVSIVEKLKDEIRDVYDQRMHQAMIKMGGDPADTIIAAMGWMFVLSPSFIAKWNNRILNVHPALLPKHGGKGMYGSHVHEAVLGAGDSESGITIHVIDEGIDTGKILVQKKCSVLPGDTVQSLQKRVQELEKEWYPKVLQMIEEGKISLQEFS